MLLRFTYTLILVAFSCLTFAQRKNDLTGIQFTHFTSALVDDLYPSLNYPDPNTFANTKIGQTQLQFFANYPFKLGEKTTLKPCLDYGLINFSYTNFPNNLSMNEIPKSVQSLNFSLELIQKFGKSWRINLQAQPGIASNLKSPLQSADFIFQSYGYLSKSFKEDDSFSLGLGASYNTLLGEYKWLPVLDIFWKSGKFKIDGTFPFKGGIYFLPSEKFEIGLAGRMQGNHYNLNFPNQPSPYGYVKYNTIFGGLAINWQIAKALIFNVEGGINANRTYQLHNYNHKKLADFDPEKFNSYFISGGIICRLE